MNCNWKHGTGAFALSSAMALSVAMLSVSAGAQVAAKPKSGGTKPPVEVTPPITEPSTEKGIKDNGVKGCGHCGLTGREAAPPATGDTAAPRTATDSWSWGAHQSGSTSPGGEVAKPKKKKGPKVRDDPAYDTSLRVVGGVAALAAIASTTAVLA